MEILFWIVLGAIAGFFADAVMGSGHGMVGDIILGILGALVGGFLFGLLGAPGVTGFNIWSLFVAFIGACVLIWLGRLIRTP